MAGLVRCGDLLVQCYHERLSVFIEKSPRGGAGHHFVALAEKCELEYRGLNTPVLCKPLFRADKHTNALVVAHESRIYYIHVSVLEQRARWEIKACCGVQRDRRIVSLAVSPFVQEECAFLDTANEIILDPLAASKTHRDQASSGSGGGYPGFRQLSVLPVARSFCFTAHPRTFALCRGNALQRVDLREPHDCEEVMCRLDRETCEYCNGKCTEEFAFVEKAPGDVFNPFCIAAASTRQVLLYDVRMGHAPMFSFAHRAASDPKGVAFEDDRVFLWTERYSDMRCFRLAKRNDFGKRQVLSGKKTEINISLVEHPFFAIEAPRKATGVNSTWSLDSTTLQRKLAGCAPVSSTRIAILVNDGELFVDEYI